MCLLIQCGRGGGMKDKIEKIFSKIFSTFCSENMKKERKKLVEEAQRALFHT